MPEKRRYRVLTPLSYGGKRRKPGDVVDDIPQQSVGWLLRDGHIEAVKKETPS